MNITDSRIFYLIPKRKEKFVFLPFAKSITKLDFSCISKFLRSENIPSGGVKICYLHCELLNKLGFYAKPLLLGDFNITWFKYVAEPTTIMKIGYDLNKSDIVVCSEVIPYEGLKFKHARKIMFVQNWIGTTVQRPFLKACDMRKSYYDLGYDAVITCGQFVADYLRRNKKGNATIITNGINQSKFFYNHKLKEKNRILWFPRKNYEDGKKITGEVKKAISDVKIVRATNLKEEQMISEYQKADIFLATGYPEGFGLPPLEAMACGCAVVGFTGGGAREFMINGKTAMVSEDGNTTDAAKKLIALICNKKLKELIRENGYQKSKEYSRKRMKKDLWNFYKSV